MIKRCIMIFPEFENGHIIDKIREKYDPLAQHVRPHITLVFPFESSISTEDLRQHLSDTLLNVQPFSIKLQGVEPVRSFGNYLFLHISEGKEEIIQIHKKLYTGILAEFMPVWLKGNNYLPHMTVGNIVEEDEFLKAAEEVKKIKDIFHTTVNRISVEIIDQNEDSIIEMHVSLTAER